MKGNEGVTHVLSPGLSACDAYSETGLEADCHYLEEEVRRRLGVGNVASP